MPGRRNSSASASSQDDDQKQTCPLSEDKRRATTAIATPATGMMKKKTKQRALSAFKLWNSRNDIVRRQQRRADQSVCFDVMGPSPEDLPFHRGHPLPPPPSITAIANNNKDNKNNKPASWHWSSVVGNKTNISVLPAVIHPPPICTDLVLVIGTERPRRPVIRQFEYVEPATSDVLDYSYERRQRHKRQKRLNKDTSTPLRHVLFTSSLDHNDGEDNQYSPDTVLGELGTVAGDSRKFMSESIPRDPDEFILNDLEIELAWIGEESCHCMGSAQLQQRNETKRDQDTHPFHWGYIWEYASPALRIELRRVDHLQGCFTTTAGEEATDNTTQNTNNDHDMSKMRRLVRWQDRLVRARFRVVRSWVRQQLNRGYRRNVMKRAMAQLRLLHRRQGHQQQAFPEPDWHLVQKDVEFWKKHVPALSDVQQRTLVNKSRRVSF